MSAISVQVSKADNPLRFRRNSSSSFSFLPWKSAYHTLVLLACVSMPLLKVRTYHAVVSNTVSFSTRPDVKCTWSCCCVYQDVIQFFSLCVVRSPSFSEFCDVATFYFSQLYFLIEQSYYSNSIIITSFVQTDFHLSVWQYFPSPPLRWNLLAKCMCGMYKGTWSIETLEFGPAFAVLLCALWDFLAKALRADTSLFLCNRPTQFYFSLSLPLPRKSCNCGMLLFNARAEGRGLGRCMVHLVGLRDVSREKRGTGRAEDYTFIYGEGNEDH
jgi:hypothetical protein